MPLLFGSHRKSRSSRTPPVTTIRLAAAAAVIMAGLVAVRCAPDAAGPASRDRHITLASTTSTHNSGLFDHILPIFTARTGVEVRVLAVGTGQAIRLAERGDVDALLVHHQPAEERFVAAGHGLERLPVMFNDFVLVGPAVDPAGVGDLASVKAVFRALAAAGSLFVSRGDDSGTHRKERTLWDAASIDIHAATGGWYREAGAGMGATLNIAVGLQAYTLTDRATWLNFANRADLQVLFEGDPCLFNQYGLIVVNPARHPHVEAADAKLFAAWLTSVDGEKAIASYEVHGRQLFFPGDSHTRESGCD